MGREYKDFATEGYSNNAIAYACIEYVSTSAASVPLIAYTLAGGKPKKLDASHPLNAILRRPNPSYGGGGFFHDLLCYKLIAGNAYILRNTIDSVKAPKEMWLVRPDYVSIEAGRYGFPAYYEITKKQGEAIRIPVDQMTGDSPLLHVRNFNPLETFAGLSKFQPSAYSVDTFSSILRWNKSLLDRGARPSGAFVYDAKDGQGNPLKLSEEQFRALKEQIDAQNSGSYNAGRPLLLDAGMDFKEMQMNPKDMDYINSKNTTARDICLAFGVPPQLIGLPDSQTYSNYAEAKLAFWQTTVLPTLGCLVDDLSRWLAPLYGVNLFIDYDKNDIDALAPVREKQFGMLQTADFLTPNEKRELTGFDPIEGGERLYIDSSKIPADLVDNIALSDTNAAKNRLLKTLPEIAFEQIGEKDVK